MTSIFISYSRKDIEFARQVVNALAEHDLDTWIDWQSIPKGEDWKKEIDRGIELAETFIFLMSPDSAQSEICNLEVAHALKNNKRVIPIVIRDTNPKDFYSENSGKEISKRNWIFCRDQTDDFDTAIQDTIETIQTDYEWVKYHTKLQVRALEWERNSHERSLLYRGKELENAELQLATNTSKEPNPTDLQHNFILNSRQSTDRQRRVTFGISIVGVIALAALSIFGFVQAGLARNAEATAIANEAAAQTAQANAESESIQRATAQTLAEDRAKIALARQLAAQAQAAYLSRNSNQMLAALLNIQSMKLYPTTSPANFLINENLAAQPLSHMTHEKSVHKIVVTSDGKYVVSANEDGVLRVWDVSTGQIINEITHDWYIFSLAVSPDGKYITAGSDKSARVWNISTGEKIASMAHDGYLTSIAVDFSPDGKYVASGGGTSVQILETATGKEIARTSINELLTSILSVAFSPDGRYLAVAGGNSFNTYILNATTGRVIRRLSQEDAVTLVGFSPSGKYLFSIGIASTVRIWEVSTGRQISSLTDNIYTYSVEFSPDSKYVISAGGDSFARVWEVTTAKEISHMLHGGFVSKVAFSPNGDYVASAGADSTVRVWSTISGQEIARMTHDSIVNGVAFSPNGDYIVSGSGDGSIRIWDTNTNKEATRIIYKSSVNTIKFNPSGDNIASINSDDTVNIWNTSKNQEVTRIMHDDRITSLAFNSDGKYLVSGSHDNIARVSDAITGQEIAKTTHDGEINAVAFSPDDKYVASGSDDNTVRIWETSTGNEFTRMVFEDSVNSVAFSPDGKYILVGIQNGTASVWDITTDEKIAQMTHGVNVNQVSFDTEGIHVISGGCDENNSDNRCVQYTVRIWDAMTGTESVRMTNNSQFDVFAISPNRKYVLTGNCDEAIVFNCIQGSAHIWEVATGQEIGYVIYEGQINSADFSPDGKYVILAGCDEIDTELSCVQGTASIWDITTGEKVAQKIHDGWVSSVTFSPDGKFAASAGCDKGGTLDCTQSATHIWAWQPEDLISNACAVMPRNLSRAEWNQYIGDSLPYQAVCENLPIEPGTIAPTP